MTQLAPSDQASDEALQVAADEVNTLVERLQGVKLQNFATLAWQHRVDSSEALKVTEADGQNLFPHIILATTNIDSFTDHRKCAYLVVNRQKRNRVMFGVYDINSARLILGESTAEMLTWLSSDDDAIVQKVIISLRELVL